MIRQPQLETILLVGVDVDGLLALAGTNQMMEALSADEQARADGYRTLELRNRFIAGRFLLRQVLSDAIGVPAEAIKFLIGVNGKPAIVDSQSQGGHFSFSRSGQYAVCAFSVASRIGVDVEQVTHIPDMELVAKEIFPEPQLLEWMDLAQPEQTLAFYRGWTRKEAVSKLNGRGITAGVLDIDVPINRFEPGHCETISPRVTGPSGQMQSDSKTVIVTEWNPFPDLLVSLAIESDFDLSTFRDDATVCDLGLKYLVDSVKSALAIQRVFEVAAKGIDA